MASPPLWTPFDDDNRRFYRILTRVFAIFSVVFVTMPFFPVPHQVREQPAAEVIPVAKLLLEPPPRRIPPPVPPAPVKLEPIKPAPVEAPPVKASPKPAPPVPQPPKPPKQEAAPKAPLNPKESVARVGLLAMRNDLVSLRESTTLHRFNDTQNPMIRSVPMTKGITSGVTVSDVGKGSGGIDVSRLSQTVGRAELGGHTATAVSAGSITGGEGGADDGSGTHGKRSRGRTIEEIQLTLQSHKGTFDILYSKELRTNPALRGRVVFELTIAPSGEVVQCRILGTELNAPELERRFVVKLRSIPFGVKNVETTVISYPLDFSPS